MLRRRLLPLLAACGAALSFGTHAAEPYPAKPIRILVGYPAGGTSDLQIRALQEPLQRILGQPVLIENRTGAAGGIATVQVAKAPPDGYTLLLPTNIFVIAPNLSKDVGFDPVADFEPVSLTSLTPLVVMVNAQLPVHSVRELIDHAKKNPGVLEYGSAGSSSFGRMATEMFSRRAGIRLLHVPYQGVAHSTQALAAGDIRVLISTISPSLTGFEKTGRIRILGVASDKPSALLPSTPLVSETLPGFVTEVWSGLVAPKGTPPEVVAKLQAAVATALQMPDVRERYATIGLVPAPSSSAEFGARLRKETGEWATLIKEADIKAD